MRFEDRHIIVTALTSQSGRITAMARNAVQSRRFGGTLDSFTASEWRFRTREGDKIVRLEEATLKYGFNGLRTDFDRLITASTMTEIALKVALPGQAEAYLFRLHSNALMGVEQSQSPAEREALLGLYILKTLKWYGSEPNLIKCLGCGLGLELLRSDEVIRLSASEAGWHCEREASCRAQAGALAYDPLSAVTLVTLDAARKLPIRDASVKLAAAIDSRGLSTTIQWLEKLLVFHIPGFDREPLKSRSFISANRSNERPPEVPAL